ncbi:MAG TPA: fluoride efflux transporter CrcB [Pirellulales bacterium]|jgi:CrcB protein|nr:fluoride efflux transporter CrcB [Pirellulales bacterium]
MKHVLLVALGGSVGALARYFGGGWVLHRTVDWRFPASTFAVNLAGCVVAGLLTGMIEKRGWFSADARLFLFTGFLGGFTTFSAFGIDTISLLRRGNTVVALAYVLSSVIAGLAGLWLALKAIEWLCRS